MRSVKGVQRYVEKVMGAVTFYTGVIVPLTKPPYELSRTTKNIARVY